MVSSIINGYYSDKFTEYDSELGMFIPEYITDYKRILNPIVDKEKKKLLFEKFYSKLYEKLQIAI